MDNNLNVQNELAANVYVAKVMRVCAVLAVTLNSVGIFSVEQRVMVVSCVGSIVLLMLPTIILHVFKKNEWWMKYVAIIGSCVFILFLGTALNFYVTIMFFLPMVLASVYFNPKLNWLALVLGVLASTAAKILAYFLNTVQDRNYYGVKSLFVKNCFPHVLMLGSIGFIFVSLGKRTDNMVSSLMGAEAQEKMLLHMKKLSEKSTEVSKGLVNEVETLTDATKSTIRVNNEISENTDTVIVGINNSMDQLEEAEGNTTQIYENIRVLAKESEEVADMFTNIEKLSNQNRTYMQQVTAGMEQATDSIGICQEAMRQLEDKTKKIDGIVDVIAEISEQTDLLSLNAAIESARAGEQGKGFAIVAEEIRKLAQQTQRTLENVREIIAEVLQQNIIAVDAMTQTSAVHAEQKEVILKTEDSSQKVMDATKNMAARMQLILNNTKNIESSASIIVDIVDSITGICKDNQNSLDEVSKSVKTGISTTNQLEQLVDAIKAMAEELAVVVQG